MPSSQYQCVHQLPMFETTFGILQESPLAIVPLVAIVWVVVQAVRRSNITARVARYGFVLGVIPPFCLFVLADLFGSQPSRGLARTLLDSEVRLVVGILDVLDRLTAATLRAFLQFVSGVTPSDPLAGVTSMLPSWDPFGAISAVGFLVAVFAVHFVAGIIVIRISRWENGASLADEWLSAAGVVLFVSGMVWMLLQFDPIGFGNFELRASVLASSMGLVTGITVSNLPVNLPAWWPDSVMGDGDTADDESKANTPTAGGRTRLASHSDTRSSRASATETATGDASRAESTSGGETADSDPSFERLQKTVESLLRR